MTTSDPKNEPKTPKADQARIRDLPEPKGLQGKAQPPDEEKQLVGGGACTNVSKSGIKTVASS